MVLNNCCWLAGCKRVQIFGLIKAQEAKMHEHNPLQADSFLTLSLSLSLSPYIFLSLSPYLASLTVVYSWCRWLNRHEASRRNWQITWDIRNANIWHCQLPFVCVPRPLPQQLAAHAIHKWFKLRNWYAEIKDVDFRWELSRPAQCWVNPFDCQLSVDLLGPDQRSKSPLQATHACVCAQCV